MNLNKQIEHKTIYEMIKQATDKHAKQKYRNQNDTNDGDKKGDKRGKSEKTSGKNFKNKQGKIENSVKYKIGTN